MVKKYIYIIIVLIYSIILHACSATPNNLQSSTKIDQQKEEEFTKFTPKYNRFYLPSINKNKLYMTIDDNSKSGMPNKLIEYDSKKNSTKVIFNSKLNSPNMQGQQANKDWLLWLDTDDFGSNSILYVKNLNNDKQKILYQSTGPIDANLYQHYVTWTEIDSAKQVGHIKVYNLKTDKVKVIATVHSYDTGYSVNHMNQGKLVYSDRDENKTNLYVYDLTSEKTVIYPIPHEYISNIRIVGDKVFYTTFPAPNQWYPESYFLVDMRTKNIEPLQLEGVSGDSNNNIGLTSAFEDYMVFQTSTQQVWIYKLQSNGYKKHKLDVSYPFQTLMSEGLDISIICENKGSDARHIMSLAGKDVNNIFSKENITTYNN